MDQEARAAPDGPHGPEGFAYLLVQLGTRAARRFAERLAPLELEPRHAGLLLRLAGSEGRSQQAIGELIGLNSTRMVFLVDELEQRGLVERRRNDADRRSYALYLTDARLGQAAPGPAGSRRAPGRTGLVAPSDRAGPAHRAAPAAGRRAGDRRAEPARLDHG